MGPKQSPWNASGLDPDVHNLNGSCLASCLDGEGGVTKSKTAGRTAD